MAKLGMDVRARALGWPLFGLALLPLVAAGSAAAGTAPPGAVAGMYEPTSAVRIAPMLPTASPITALAPSAANVALPSGGVVRAGDVTIGSASGGSLSIGQSSAKGIIDWAGFSIGKGGEVRFNNGSGATLNRVTGGSVSSLDGLLSASGSVYLLNPNGVVVGRDGVVDVGGRFVASTLNLSDEAFLKGGDLTFTGPSTAAVVNLGRIGALGGDVALIASVVENRGSIDAPNGTVGLAAGSSVLLRDASLNDGKFLVQVGGAGTSATNAGAITAAAAELRANGGDVYALAGNTGGFIRAQGVSAQDGRVFLTAGDGSVTAQGEISARGASGAGGFVETSAAKVDFADVKIDAGQGGTWLLDPNDLTIDQGAANAISSSLNAGTNVTQSTSAAGTGGSGDININPNVSINWGTGAGLTLSAFRNIGIGAGAMLTSSGGATVTLYADNTGTGVGTVTFGANAKVSTSGAVNIFYNPPNAAQAYQSKYQFPTNYSPFIAGGAKLTGYMLVNTPTDLNAVGGDLRG